MEIWQRPVYEWSLSCDQDLQTLITDYKEGKEIQRAQVDELFRVVEGRQRPLMGLTVTVLVSFYLTFLCMRSSQGALFYVNVA